MALVETIWDGCSHLPKPNESCTIVYMDIVADTNIFLVVALDQPEKNNIIQLTSGCEIISPEILPYEIGNALSAIGKSGDTILNYCSLFPLKRINKKDKLHQWLNYDLKERFRNRIIDFDLKTATVWGQIQAHSELSGKAMPAIDGQIVATGIF